MEGSWGSFMLFSAILDLPNGQRFWCGSQTPHCDPPHHPVTAEQVMSTWDTRIKAAPTAIPVQKASVSPHYHAYDVDLEGLGKSKENNFVLSKMGTFLTWELGTWTAQHLGTHLGFKKSLSGNTKIQTAYQSCFLLCPLLWVFSPFSESHTVPETRGRVKKPSEICQCQIFFFPLNCRLLSAFQQFNFASVDVLPSPFY